MSELAPKTLQKERGPLLLEPQPRDFTNSDVIHIQNYLKKLHDEGIAEGADLIFNDSHLYDTLTEAPDNLEVELPAEEHSFDKAITTLLSIWGERRGLPSNDTPKSLTEASDLFVQNPKLNDISPIHFQGGAEYASGRFVHVKTGRVMDKHREPSNRRYYLNPTTDKMGRVVEQLTGAALEAGVPLYFKFVNVATGSASKRTLERNDRVVIYGSESQTTFIEDLLSRIASENPEAFAGRQVAGFGETLLDGITKADDVTKEQNDKFKSKNSEGTSFNALRAKLIYEATINVTKDLVSRPEYGSITIEGQTIRQKFASQLSNDLGRFIPGVTITENDPMLLEAVALNLDSDKLLERGFSERVVKTMQQTLAKTARDILPQIKPESLLPGYRHHIQQVAPKYGINPNNLAENVPITT